MKIVVFTGLFLSILLTCNCTKDENNQTNQIKAITSGKAASETDTIVLKHTAPSMQETVRLFLEGIKSGNDSLAYAQVVSAEEYPVLLSASNKKGTAEGSAFITGLFIASNAKHFKRWKKRVLTDQTTLISVEPGPLVEEKGYTLVTKCTVTVSDQAGNKSIFEGITTFVKIGDQYKIWSLNDT